MGLIVLFISAPVLVPLIIGAFIYAIVSDKKRGCSGRYYVVDEYDARDVFGDYGCGFIPYDFTHHECSSNDMESHDSFGTDLLCGGIPYGDGELYMEDDASFFEGCGENYM